MGIDRHQRFLDAFLACQNDLRAFVVSSLRDWDQADDLMQELATVLWSQFDDYDSTRPFGAWARGIARNLVLRQYDQRSRNRRILGGDALAAVERAFTETEDGLDHERRALRECLTGLGDKARELLRLRYEDGLAVETVAERSEMAFEAVKKALLRIRQRLLDCCSRRLAPEVAG